MEELDKPRVHGSCPGALQPMQAADGLIVRIRPPFSRLSQSQVIALAELAQQYGTGHFNLTSRANLQMRGVAVRHHAALMKALIPLGLVDTCVEHEQRRNLVQTPFWVEGDANQQVVERLTDALLEPDAPNLPAKFGFAVDCGPRPVLSSTAADIRIQRCERGELMCLADGMNTGVRVSIATAADAAIRLARWFLDNGGAPEGRGRMATLLARGLRPALEFKGVRAASGSIDLPEPGAHPSGWLVAPEFGLLTSQELHAMAPLGAWRLTPWRMILIEGVGREAGLGLGLRAGDSRLRVSVCTGAPGCTQARSSTFSAARSLAVQLPEGEHLHVSGCAKGCAHPAPASITLMATAPDQFSLIRHGKACDEPLRVGLSTEQLTCHPEILLDMSEHVA